ncbi:MAG: SDR family oxidoreductase [Bacteroidales bacterium]|nr:SDR family oxidoreductase [Bacteroidales bacterium]
MILITGATGHFGRATIDFLLKKNIPANEITAMVRNVAKAEDLKNKGIRIKVGDYDDYSSLLSAFKGIDKLLFISGNDMQNRVKQHENAVKAAKEAGVKHIIYTSFVRKNETETSPIAMLAKAHIETEKNIKASGIPYTIMRNNFYADVLPMFLGEKVLEAGIFLPAGDGKASFATRLDMAEAAANILTGEGHENKEYVIANDTNYSLNEVATFLSEVTGKQITYTNPTTEVYRDTLLKTGVPTDVIGMIAGFSEAVRQGELSTTKSDLGNLLGRKPTTLKEYLKSVYSNK